MENNSPLKLGFVYFIETESHEFVKIGYSKRIYTRLSELSTLQPGSFAIRLIGYFPGTQQTEGWLHAKFAADRDNGEWFRSTSALRQFIEAMGLIQPSVPAIKTRRIAAAASPAIAAPIELLELSGSPKKKNPHAAALGKRGGKARAANLTPVRRSEIARLGAETVNAKRAAARLKAKGRKRRPVKKESV